MPEYMNKEVFLSSMGLTGDETKYGNRDAEHQHRSYSTYMSYEIMDSLEDSIVEEELAPVRHGRWEKVAWWQHQNRYECNECSICGCRVKPKFTYNYCPHCGAKMDLPDECEQEVER